MVVLSFSSSLLSKKTLTVNKTFLSARVAPVSRRLSLITKAAEESVNDVRCFVNSEGHLQCEKLQPGDYVVKSMAPQEHPGTPPGVLYCHVTEDGSLLCEGLPEGEYKLDSATPDDIQQFYDNVVNQK
eukprot:TRINITY_DN1363_c1_g1_i1.p3 TRINITY_DN1363_c1_g1~~TRINITY_DN1363_c1_g1_i1.p3  ORF type:complete len:128 (+),score=14.62 TRINITY_DN1363_c1_g1_i1:122-505(+)